MPTLHAFDSLSQSLDWQNESTIVLFGDDSFLKQRVLGMLTEDYESKVGFPATVFDGNVVEWRDVSDEVATVSLFGGDARRVAVVDNADRMITQYRDRLESYFTQESTTGCLVLLVNRWQANTRLYKSVDRVGLQIECRAPLAARKKELDEPRIVKWMMAWAKQQHQCEIDKAAAEELLGLVGSSLGMLYQDLAKLSLFVEPGEVIDVAKIQSVVGGWRQKTAWEILDAGMDGDVAGAVSQLDHLLQAGEAAPAIFAQLSWALRRFAQVTDQYLRELRNRQKVNLPAIFKACGFRDWPAGSLKRNEQRLIRLGRERAAQLHRWLLETDLALKSSHSSPDRARYALEFLFMRMNRELKAPK
ncbi:MAG: DNA polymerase III subunit delta [Planctomycetota bacterium]|nr:DNA polymerase III subunit delta [Planctomycetota bacterium]